MKRGDVFWHRFASPDKRRPVVVLTRSTLVPLLNTVLVASVTTSRRGARSEVAVGPEQGLPKPSAVNLHNIFTVERSELGPYITSFRGDVMTRIDGAALFVLGIGEQPLNEG